MAATPGKAQEPAQGTFSAWAGRAQVPSQRAPHPPGADAPETSPFSPTRGFPTFHCPESGAQSACKKSLFQYSPPSLLLCRFLLGDGCRCREPLGSQATPSHSDPLPGGDPGDPSPQGPGFLGTGSRARCPEGLLRFPGTLSGKRGVGQQRAGGEPGERSGCGPGKGAGSGGRRGEEATHRGFRFPGV